MQKRIKAGLVGAGYVSKYHVMALQRLPNVKLIGIFDNDTAKATQAAEEYNIRSYPSLKELCEAGAEVIHILTPPHTHAQLTLEALQLNAHVLVEKPLAIAVDDCLKIQKLAAEKNKQVCVNHSLLYDPQIQKALKTVQSGKIGKIISVDILRSSEYPPFPSGNLPPQYRDAGYPFRDLGVHALYLFQTFLGKIENVQASWKSHGGDPNLAYDEWCAMVQCASGTGQLQLSWNVKPMQSRIIIQGSKGVLDVNLFQLYQTSQISSFLPRSVERLSHASIAGITQFLSAPANVIRFLCKKVLPFHGLQNLVQEFYQALAKNRKVPVPISDALDVVKWTEEIARAADQDYKEQLTKLRTSENIPFLVTGASGGLGREIVKQLTEDKKPFRQMLRRMPSELSGNSEIVLGDLGNPEAVDKAVAGADIVIHAGATMSGSWLEHQRGTVAGTRNIIAACLKHKVRKLIYISSISVVDWAGSHQGVPMSENTTLEQDPDKRGSYTKAKLEAEKLVLEYCHSKNLPAVILRPGQIFGDQMPLLTSAVARNLAGRKLVLGNGDLRLPLVHVEDVVAAIMICIEKDLKNGEIFQLIDPQSVTQNEVLKSLLPKDASVIRLPRWIIFMVGSFSEVFFSLVGRQSPFSCHRLSSAMADLSFDSSKAKEQLGWAPKQDLSARIAAHAK